MAPKVIIHRRHTMRTKPGQHLSQEGVELARKVGEGMPAFDLVITSTIPRAFETSIAMGYAVDRQVEILSEMPEGKEISWESGFDAHARCVREQPDGVVARFARALAEFHRDVADELPDGGHALMISHGGFIEPSAVGCLPDLDYASWGPPCNYCEGVKLVFDGGEFVDGELLRVTGTILIN